MRIPESNHKGMGKGADVKALLASLANGIVEKSEYSYTVEIARIIDDND